MVSLLLLQPKVKYIFQALLGLNILSYNAQIIKKLLRKFFWSFSLFKLLLKQNFTFSSRFGQHQISLQEEIHGPIVIVMVA